MRRAQLGGVPAGAWLCAAVAILSAAAWSFITPPFEVPDEPEHVAYVKVLAEAGRLPTAKGSLSAEETFALRDMRLQQVAEEPEYQPIASRAENARLQHALTTSRGSPGAGQESAGVAASQPPLYYALQAIPYSLAAGGTLLDRIALMRLFSALMAGLTALFTFLFIRETLPRVAWAWTVGGLAVALAPLLGFMSGAVNPDAMLYAVSAATFYCLARGFRRGLTRGRALVLGAAIAIGLLTKLNYVGLAPGALLGLVVLSRRATRTQGRNAYVSLALACALALSPAAVYVLGHVITGAPALGIVSRVSAGTHGSLAGELSYVWQLYLPRLPGMHDDFAGIVTARQIWFDGYVGLYGWLDTPFPGWVYELALVPAALVAGLCVRDALASARALRARAAEVVVYCVMCVGLLALIGADSYSAFPMLDAEYGQARYLLPLLPLLGVVLAMAARGAGRRWAASAGAAIVMLFLAHDLFSQLQVLARFYG
jgi:4-amino-4-deoxy-L-arabinose transferase-like glycosyltransferase